VKYKWVGKRGDMHYAGVVEAASLAEARAKIIVNVDEIVSIEAIDTVQQTNKPHLKKIKDRQLSEMWQQLAILLRSGVPLLDAIEITADEFGKTRIGKILNYLSTRLREGERLGAAMKESGIFPYIDVTLIQLAEASGNLDQIMQHLADLHKRRANIRGQIIRAMIYPIFVLFLALAALGVFLGFVIPRISMLYSKFHKELPSLTKAILAMSRWLVQYWWLLAIIILGVWLVWMILLKIPSIRYWWDKTKLRGFIGKIILTGESINIWNAFLILVRNGIGIIEALDITEQMTQNTYLRKEIRRIKTLITDQGLQLHEALRASNVFPKKLSIMVSIGETAGSLDTGLSNYIEAAQVELDNKINTLVSLIEPMAIVIVGGIVLILMLAMYLPIFSLSNITK